MDIPLSSPTGAFEVHWTGGEQPALRIQRGGCTVWESIPGRAFVTAGRGTEEVHESRGLFSVEDSLEERCVDQSVTNIVTRDPGAVFHQQGSEAGDAFRARLLEDGLR